MDTFFMLMKEIGHTNKSFADFDFVIREGQPSFIQLLFFYLSKNVEL